MEADGPLPLVYHAAPLRPGERLVVFSCFHCLSRGTAAIPITQEPWLVACPRCKREMREHPDLERFLSITEEELERINAGKPIQLSRSNHRRHGLRTGCEAKMSLHPGPKRQGE